VKRDTQQRNRGDAAGMRQCRQWAVAASPCADSASMVTMQSADAQMQSQRQSTEGMSRERSKGKRRFDADEASWWRRSKDGAREGAKVSAKKAKEGMSAAESEVELGASNTIQRVVQRVARGSGGQHLAHLRARKAGAPGLHQRQLAPKKSDCDKIRCYVCRPAQSGNCYGSSRGVGGVGQEPASSIRRAVRAARYTPLRQKWQQLQQRRHRYDRDCRARFIQDATHSFQAGAAQVERPLLPWRAAMRSVPALAVLLAGSPLQRDLI
jgi:hypothetical protein